MTPDEQAALWLELTARLPGLKCQDCGGSGAFTLPDDEQFGWMAGLETACPQAAHWPDLALLLRAAREAGYRYKLAWSGKGYVVQFMRGEWIPPVFDYPDELTAAMLAVKRALDAEKERNHD